MTAPASLGCFVFIRLDIPFHPQSLHQMFTYGAWPLEDIAAMDACSSGRRMLIHLKTMFPSVRTSTMRHLSPPRGWRNTRSSRLPCRAPSHRTSEQSPVRLGPSTHVLRYHQIQAWCLVAREPAGCPLGSACSTGTFLPSKRPEGAEAEGRTWT